MESENKKNESVSGDEMLKQMKDGVSSNIKAAADEIKDEINEASERVDAIKSQDDYQKPISTTIRASLPRTRISASLPRTLRRLP